ncbi:hypothetical protein [Criblamydia sequanensis]|uniref:Conserved putative secreted protein n=1 Tax=Candidatus Criblamydia sequanensis CRIB-18 TaxID=1437425 RepID=A0A090D3E7_9BACT|nr:hypothetical protein [Criblamydia sequanensis]CDR35253.1 Conserved putative secreted protein [Criblamydia sequanensis CRIB-18]
MVFRNILLTALLITLASLYGDNQTSTLSPVLPQTPLPFNVNIELANLTLPNGWHSGSFGTWDGKVLLFAGRTNGLHGFDDDPNVNNFPPSQQNTMVYVIDFASQTIWQRSLYDPASGLTQAQIDTLSVTSPQCYQSGHTLYMTGGYGIDTATGTMGTKPVLSALDIPGIVQWVIEPKSRTFAKYLRQTTHPLVQVTGGEMFQLGPHQPTLLIFGQNFTGEYRDNSNGQYTRQVRSFHILDDGKHIYVAPSEEEPLINPAYRRRDLNVVPIMYQGKGKSKPRPGYLALSGVFTETSGIWTVPVFISPQGKSLMPDPEDPNTFKQAMNNYACANVGLFSENSKDMYIVLFGGITYGYFENGVFQTDSEIPFTNEVTTIKMNRRGVFTQYLMDNQYPTIPSTFTNPGNPLLFGAGAQFIRNESLPIYQNGVLAFDKLRDGPIVIGYIVGGIQSTLPNTETNADSAASPYLFLVTLSPR